MGDEDHRRAEPFVQLRELDARPGAQPGVEVGERLVEQEHVGLADDGAADRHALALPAGKLRRLAVEQMRHLEDLRRHLDALVDIGGRAC